MEERKNRIADALNIRGMRQIELSERTGISQSQINSWKRNRWQPKQTALYKMAKVLNVSELWLAGYDVPMDRPAEQKDMDNIVNLLKTVRENKRYVNLMDYIVKLNEDQILIVEQMVEQMRRVNGDE